MIEHREASMIDKILEIVAKNEEWRGNQCLNLISSENLMSPLVRKLLSTDFAHRYTARDRFYMGTKFIDEIELYGERLAKEVFRAEIADLRPLSGHIADLIVLANSAVRKDTLLCVSPENGGYPGMWREGLAGFLELKPVSFPFSKVDSNIQVDRAREIIEKANPKLVIFGASLIIFPHPVKQLAETARENGAFVGFDGSHVLGLIAGEQFQDPLREGAHAMFGSTHKSFFGPQGGIIVAEKKHGELLKEKIYPAFVDNAHWNRIASLTLALAEMKEFGKAYASQVVRNSQVLAKALHDQGFPVICKHLGFTQSHQVVIDYESHDEARRIANQLQKSNIIVDCVIRLGTCEVTRRGMKEAEMHKIAELMNRAIAGEDSEKIKKAVAEFVSDFREAQYTFAL